ncbi:MAG: HEAT repeat domain-containing protein, partial [Candidatus Krumholzibacteria bacterium]|nr:HEAT repeat domain-containing protein [Candidatus Krumholzibacteria bacterium]
MRVCTKSGIAAGRAAAALLLLVSALLPAAPRAHAAGSRYAKLLADAAGRSKLQSLALMEEERTTDGIERLVSDRDPLVRLRCAEVLGRAGSGGTAVRHLAALARDADASVSAAAIYSLGLTMEEAAVEALGEVLAAGMKPQWLAAIEALGVTRQRRAVPLIVPYLKNFHAEVRAAAATALAVLGDSSAAGQCVNSLFDPDPRVVARVAYAMGRLGHEPSAGQMIGLLGHGDAEVRARSAEALGRLRFEGAAGPLAGLLGPGDRMLAVRAAEALGRIATDECAKLLEPLLRSDDPWMRALALQGIAASERKKSCDAVLPLLADPSIMVRRAAIEAAARTDGGKSRDQILAIARTGAPYDRMAALEWLGDIGDEADAALLASVLSSSGNHLEREGAAAGLGRIGDRGLLFKPAPAGGRSAFEVLLAAAGDDDWVVGTMSIDALGAEAKNAVDTLAAVFGRFTGRADADRRLAV